jgi:hypothetical protein
MMPCFAIGDGPLEQFCKARKRDRPERGVLRTNVLVFVETPASRLSKSDGAGEEPIGAGEVLIAAEIPMEFHAIRNRAKFVLDEMLDALLDVFLWVPSGHLCLF